MKNGLKRSRRSTRPWDRSGAIEAAHHRANRRQLSRIAERSGAARIVDSRLAPPNAVPQSPQNFSRGSFSTPHEGHTAFNGAPHCAQNFRPSRLSVPHFRTAHSTHSPCRGSALAVIQVACIEAKHEFAERIVLPCALRGTSQTPNLRDHRGAEDHLSNLLARVPTPQVNVTPP
jgi:hypothetical protein